MKSITSPSTTRTLRSPRLSIASSTAATPGRVHIDADDMLARARLGDFDQRLAATEADVEDHVAGSVPNTSSNDSCAPSTAIPHRSMARA